MEFAVKKIDKSKIRADKRNEKLFDQELEILKVANHPNIIRVFNISDDKSFFYIV